MGAAFVVVMAAGADHPVPPGFVWAGVGGILLVVMAVATLPVLLRWWDASRRGRSIAGAAGCGAIASAILWTLAGLVNGHPDVADPAAIAIGYAVTSLTGSLGWITALIVARTAERLLGRSFRR
jgi:hypothetical protein